VIARAITAVVSLSALHFRHRLASFELPKPSEMWASWRRVLYIGIPSGATNLLMPLSAGVILRIIASFGEPAVAACGAARRVEMFAFMIPMALGISIVPFIGQNWGAGRIDRVNQCRKYSARFALGWGVLSAVVFIVFSRPIAQLFSDDPRVVEALALYLRIIPLGYGLREVHRYAGFAFNAIERPLSSASIGVIRIVVLLVPLAYLGAQFFGLAGVFWGTVAADVLSAAVAVVWARRLFSAL
jgi:Na+-driven multidrug efflux pump